MDAPANGQTSIFIPIPGHIEGGRPQAAAAVSRRAGQFYESRKPAKIFTAS